MTTHTAPPLAGTRTGGATGCHAAPGARVATAKLKA